MEPRLTVYTLSITPQRNSIPKSNRWLFRNIIGEANENELEDSYIIAELFKKFISVIDQPEMYKDERSLKSITANQPDIADSNVEPNINFHSDRNVFEGVIEGGAYGRKRKKTATFDKKSKAEVSPLDAITDDFYFFLYLPPEHDRMVLMIQSYSGESIDSVLKTFWENFFRVPNVFYKPKIKRFVPEKIINDFKQATTVSELYFSTEVPGDTLLDPVYTTDDKKFKITVRIEAVGDDFSMQEFESATSKIQDTEVRGMGGRLGGFFKRRGKLKDTTTHLETPFDLDSNFQIEPIIALKKYIDFPEGEIDFRLIKNYCFKLLENDIKPQVFLTNAIQER